MGVGGPRQGLVSSGEGDDLAVKVLVEAGSLVLRGASGCDGVGLVRKPGWELCGLRTLRGPKRGAECEKLQQPR